ncbi:hypothetical protein PUN28_020866 [Cardiocondyla obscurior]|uniref:Uncharacterized protein n=1 Tax=Cardiocondyla obscurior TaxID=286306 RepID=A0AAW2E9B4_9HYME
MTDFVDKNYAVVKFLSDCSYSEIPIAWLSKEGEVMKCWWPPRNANAATFITNYTSPNTMTWSLHEVELTKYCYVVMKLCHNKKVLRTVIIF